MPALRCSGWVGSCCWPCRSRTASWSRRSRRITWSETSAHVAPRASLTERARQEACRLVGDDELDVASVAALLGVGWSTVMRAVRDYGSPLVDDPSADGRRLGGGRGRDRVSGRQRPALDAVRHRHRRAARAGPADCAAARRHARSYGKRGAAVVLGPATTSGGCRTGCARSTPFRGSATALTASLPGRRRARPSTAAGPRG